MQTTIITHIDMSKSNLQAMYPSFSEDVIIKENCYIGVRVTILKGVTINSSSIIAACSLVNKDVASGVVYGGIPAKKINSLDGV